MRNTLCFTSLLLSLAVPVSSFAGAPPLAFAKHFGSAGNTAIAEAVAIDLDGEVCIAGTFTGSINFGGPSWTYTSAGGVDIFLAEFNRAGVIQWARQIGSPLDDFIGDMVIDSLGNILITGLFNDALDFGGGNLTPTGPQDTFLAKYEFATGAHIWSTHFGGTGFSEGAKLAIDASDNIGLVGEFTLGLDVGGGTMNAVGAMDGFFAKYDTFGQYKWSRQYGGTMQELTQTVAFDASGGVVVGGLFHGSLTIDGHPLVSTNQDVFVVKYSATGVNKWVRSTSGTGNVRPLDLVIDSAHNIYLTGRLIGSTSFGGATLTSAGMGDVFLAKLNTLGNHVWSTNYGSVNNDAGQALLIGPNKNVLMTGDFIGSVNFGGGTVVGDASSDMILADYDSTGVYQWARTYAAPLDQHARGVTTDGGSGVALCGEFAGSVDFGGAAKLTGVGTQDAFVAFYSAPASGVGNTPANASLALVAYPNPFNPQTTLSYTLPEREHVSIVIFDAAGERIARLVDEEEPRGSQAITWNGHDDHGRAVGSGVYFARLTSPHETRDVKLTILK